MTWMAAGHLLDAHLCGTVTADTLKKHPTPDPFMAEYFYRARTRLGDLTKGTVKAASPERASEMLREHGLVPLELQDVRERGLWRRELSFRRVKIRDRAIFSRQLATMIAAGIPILQAIRVLVQQTENPRLSDILREVSYEVEGGGSLSTALEKYPRVFSEFFVSMVRSGEASGKVASALETLAEHEERDAELVRKVRTALAYPAFVVTLMVILGIVTSVFVLPQIAEFFAEVNAPLPFLTRALIAVTTFLQNFWWFVLFFLVLAVYLISAYFRTPEGRYNASAVALRVPIIGRLLRKLYLARFAGALATLLDSEVPVVRALLIARDVLTSRVYQAIVDGAVEDVKGGSPISAALEKYPEIPFMVSEMVSVGERSGQLGGAFGSIYRFFRRDVDDALTNLTVLLEPIVIVLVGIGVAVLLVAILMPLYGLVQVIS